MRLELKLPVVFYVQILFRYVLYDVEKCKRKHNSTDRPHLAATLLAALARAALALAAAGLEAAARRSASASRDSAALSAAAASDSAAAAAAACAEERKRARRSEPDTRAPSKDICIKSVRNILPPIRYFFACVFTVADGNNIRVFSLSLYFLAEDVDGQEEKYFPCCSSFPFTKVCRFAPKQHSTAAQQ